MSGQESWLFSDKKYRNGISLVTICELQEESNVSAVLLAQENTISQDERKCGSIQCPDTGNEGLMDKCHLGMPVSLGLAKLHFKSSSVV